MGGISKWVWPPLLLVTLVRLWMIQWDPFLQLWDERFHALVALNMLSHPFVPILVEPTILPYDFTNWTGNYIWLHKPPLMLWSMAGSLALFGAEPWAVRLPGALASVLLIPVLIRMGQLVGQRRAGWIAAWLWTFSWYALELNAGVLPLGQNDLLFACIVTASIWTWLEWTHQPNWRWALLTGLFVGLAVLTKWLTGILVIGGWGLYLLLDKQHRWNGRSYLQLLLVGIVGFILAAPWQFYIFQRFPQEARYEMEYNSHHIWQVVEKHTGDALFYVGRMDQYLGDGMWLLLLLGLVVAFWKGPRFRHGAMVAMIAVVWIFFSLVAATKMVSYVFVTLPMLLLYIGVGLEGLYQAVASRWPRKYWRWIGALVLIALAWHTARPVMLYNLHELDKPNRFINDTRSRPIQRHNVFIYRQLDSLLEPTDLLITNSKHLMISARFFSDRHVYDCCPDSSDLLTLHNQGFTIYYTQHPWINSIYASDTTAQPIDIDIRPLP